MPKEHKKRGRREQHRKRKREQDEPDEDVKRPKNAPDQDPAALDDVSYHEDGLDGVTRPGSMPFYGMLDDDEQEYFRKADETLELNQFEDPEARSLFLANVYKEAEGKELKMANSQSCSRLMEKLILLSTPQQLRNLFQKFNGEFVHLIQHRFASHCCEALFIQAAPIVAHETSKPETLQTPPSSNPNDVFVTMENLFLYTLDEMEAYLGFLMTDRFASHVLRVLLVVLSGAPLAKEDKSTLHSKKKEKVSVPGASKTQEWTLGQRKVPQSFLDALEKIIKESVAGLDTKVLRMLAVHPTGNPTLQLLLKLELSKFGKSRAKDENSVIRKLLPDDPIVDGTESASFINGLVYDPIGSRLLETIIESAPGKLFKAVYGEFFRDRMGSLARNEIAGYVATKILERLSKDELSDAMHRIITEIPGLIERNRTAILRILIERCVVRGVDTLPLKTSLQTAYSGSNGFDVTRMLKLSEAPDDGKPQFKHEYAAPDKVHGSLLAQAMLAVPGPLGNLIFDSLTNLGEQLTFRIARDPTASRTLQAALTSPNASIITRRKIIHQFYGHVAELALDPAGSRVIDAIWDGTQGLAFIRERIAEELSENEAALRESHVGRAVWRNWRMDLYRRRRIDWVKQSRYAAGNDGFHSFPESKSTVTQPLQNPRVGKHMTAIELARRKHAEAKAALAKEAKEAGESHKKEKEKNMGADSRGSSSKGKGKASVAAH